MIIRIFDTHDGLLLSLSTILDLFGSLISDFHLKQWEIVRARSGYGKNVCELEDRLDNGERAPLSIDELRKWLADGEHFDSARLECKSEGLVFGVEDSTYLFVESQDADFIHKIAANYHETQISNTRY